MRINAHVLPAIFSNYAFLINEYVPLLKVVVSIQTLSYKCLLT